MLHTQLYALANERLCGCLKARCRRGLEHTLFTNDGTLSGGCDSQEAIDDGVITEYSETIEEDAELRAELAGPVYASTPENDRGLRDILLFSILQNMNPHNTVSVAYRNLLRQGGQVAEEIWLTKLEEGFKCSNCKTRGPILTSVCGCGKYSICWGKECAKDILSSALCIYCLSVGYCRKDEDDKA